MAHTAMSRIGPMLGGPDTLIGALRDAVGPEGTVMAYADWDAGYEDLLDADGRVPDNWRPHVPPFDPATARAVRDNGVLPEFLRTTPGALRSGNPGASVVAIGARADSSTITHSVPSARANGTSTRLIRLPGTFARCSAWWSRVMVSSGAPISATLPPASTSLASGEPGP
jgi:aminoglycoside 3-N-acetyltransferase